MGYIYLCGKEESRKEKKKKKEKKVGWVLVDKLVLLLQ